MGSRWRLSWTRDHGQRDLQGSDSGLSDRRCQILALAVPVEYRYGDRPTKEPSYAKTYSVVEAIYSSRRLSLPFLPPRDVLGQDRACRNSRCGRPAWVTSPSSSKPAFSATRCEGTLVGKTRATTCSSSSWRACSQAAIAASVARPRPWKWGSMLQGSSTSAVPSTEVQARPPRPAKVRVSFSMRIQGPKPWSCQWTWSPSTSSSITWVLKGGRGEGRSQLSISGRVKWAW